MKTPAELAEELRSFHSLWEGGFFQGDPADPLFGLYGLHSYMGVSHAILLACVKPYIRPDVTALEIGCGRGAWTRHMLGAKAVYCLDALSAEHNGFWEYVGRRDHVRYFQVTDFSMEMIPEGSVDYVFSYDALCHVSFDGLSEYARNLYPRMRPGAVAFWMVADYAKYNAFVASLDRTSVLNVVRGWSTGRLYRLASRIIIGRMNRWSARKYGLRRLAPDLDDAARPGRWFDAGKDRTVAMLRNLGYEVVAEDMGLDFRSPIVQFRRPVGP
ncbi:MAG TPA: class I SAM-dependent methyltransferase [Thermoanaerobaculaceae bacterium]|nr:class I SAM-dependent methyltransferase [Thermoanaerobaculaceae bacterium]